MLNLEFGDSIRVEKSELAEHQAAIGHPVPHLTTCLIIEDENGHSARANLTIDEVEQLIAKLRNSIEGIN